MFNIALVILVATTYRPPDGQGGGLRYHNCLVIYTKNKSSFYKYLSITYDRKHYSQHD